MVKTNKQLEVIPAKVSKPINTATSTATSSTLQTFNNPEFGDVRVITKDGEPWFVGKDVAKVLGYKNEKDAIKRHCDEGEVVKHALRVQTGIKRDGTPAVRDMDTFIINESGLYSLILSSKLPSAKKFKHWVTSEVLPSIRKTGGYVDENRSDLFLTLQ